MNFTKQVDIGIKILLIVLFLLCLLDMSYGFYQLVRIIALVGFIILAYSANKRSNEKEKILYFGLALLFQPIIKIPLGRLIWNIVDVIVAVGLILSIVLDKRGSYKH